MNDGCLLGVDMTEKSLSRMLARYFGPKLQQQYRKAEILGLAALCFLTAGTAHASDVLRNVSFQPLPGGAVDVVLELESGTVEPKVFATSDPPRIAIDLPDTANQFETRMLSIATGAAKGLTAVEAGGRTRVVIDLFRSAPYAFRREGKTFVLSVQNGFADVVTSKAPLDPAKIVSGAAQLELTAVDFRRGKAGEGRLILAFSGDNANANLREEGGRLVLDLPNVALPDKFRRKLDVVDFATPVESIDVQPQGSGTRMSFTTSAPDYEKLAYQAGSEYVVEISPKREAPKKRAASDPPVYSGNRVTFNFQDIPVRSVLQLVADVSELNIVVADSVQGNVTLRLVNVPWDQALDIILQAKGLDKRRNGTVVWVAPTKEIAEREQALEDARIAMEDRSEVVVDYISVSYGKAEEFAKLLTTDNLVAATGGSQTQSSTSTTRGVLSPRGSVSFDVRTNTLIVTDIPDRVAKVRSLIAMLDKPVKQVLIEARIVIAQEGFRNQIGARFGVSGARQDGDGNLITVGGTLAATNQMVGVGLANRLAGRPANPLGIGSDSGAGVIAPATPGRLNFNLPVVDSGAGSFAATILGADYILDLELSALEAESRGELLSSPKVITSDQQEAVIRQGQDVGYETVEITGGVLKSVVAFKEVLLELAVTPRITADGRVFLTLKVKKDNVAGFITTPTSRIPTIDRREVQTGALVDNGQTVVLGGIYEFERNDDLTKVPVLGDIPGIGNLFRNKNRTNSKVELLIFVTPKILVDSK